MTGVGGTGRKGGTGWRDFFLPILAIQPILPILPIQP